MTRVLAGPHGHLCPTCGQGRPHYDTACAAPLLHLCRYCYRRADQRRYPATAGGLRRRRH